MKNTKIWLFGLALLAWNSKAMAQNEVDALRYSQLGFGGTARIQGLAGAQTALGADASSMAGNPAGLGFYRKSEFTFSPGFNFNNTSSTLGSLPSKDSRNNFNFSQLGIVFADRKADEVVNNWRAGAFGIGFTRQNSFQSNMNYNGLVADNHSQLQALDEGIVSKNITLGSLQDEYDANNNAFTSLTGLAFETYLVDYDSASNALYVPLRKGIVTQSGSFQSRGAQNQWDFSYGASYKDKLFIGGSLGLTTLRYEEDRTYAEKSAAEEPVLNDFAINDFLTTTGSGINFRLGLIYKPVDALRIGGTIQTPTFMSLHDKYGTTVYANYKAANGGLTSYSAQSLDGVFDYNLTTPFRANGGLAYFIGKYGFVSADVEYVDYPNASLSVPEDNASGKTNGRDYFYAENNVIENKYQGAVNYRFGAEARFDIFRVRGGFAYYGDPYRNSNVDRARKYFTGGIGLREKRYFIDAAYIYSTSNSYFSPYTLKNNAQPVVSTDSKNTNFVITAGFNF